MAVPSVMNRKAPSITSLIDAIGSKYAPCYEFCVRLRGVLDLAGRLGRDRTAAQPVPDDERTTFPDDLPMPANVGASGQRRRLVSLGDLARSKAAQLAAMVPGRREMLLYAASRGDYADEIAASRNMPRAEVDALLGEGDGTQLVQHAG